MIAFNWSTFATLSILAATIHWIIARAEINRWFWDAIWLPERIDALLRCPACSSFWIGLALGAAGLRPLITGHWWLDVPIAALSGAFGAPVAQALFLWGLERTKIH